MPTYVITGGTPLYGSVRVGGAKNASYKLMISALLASTPSRLLNFSKISDVELVAQLIRNLGGQAQQVGERAYMIDPKNLSKSEISAEHGEASRASTMFIPILLHKFGRARVPFPGGDKIGKRSLERHFEGLTALGAKVSQDGDMIEVVAEKLVGTTYRFAKNSHTGTETLLMASVLAEGTTTLENAAQETEVDELISYLNQMGADIKRVEPRTIVIKGVQSLHGVVFKIMPDRNQVVSFACAALATKGDVIVEDARAKDLTAFLDALSEAKAGYEVGQYGIRFYYQEPLQATQVTTLPHPGFMTDWQPLWVTLMTQATGTSQLHETIYEKRFGYVPSLQAMGAKIEYLDMKVDNPESVYNFNLTPEALAAPHAIAITGPAALKPGEFEVKDLRHGATLMIAGMIASGQTILHDPSHQIDRGYEELDQQFRVMGATIDRRET